MKEPNTDAGYEQAINDAGYDLIDHGGGAFSVRNRESGGQTALEANDFSEALWEAFHLVYE